MPTFGCVLNLLERTGLAEGGAQMVLAEAERCGSSAKELHASLMDVVSRGHEIPKVSTRSSLDSGLCVFQRSQQRQPCGQGFGFIDASLRATMALGVLFGREEDDGDTSITVPPEIIVSLPCRTGADVDLSCVCGNSRVVYCICRRAFWLIQGLSAAIVPFRRSWCR